MSLTDEFIIYPALAYPANPPTHIFPIDLLFSMFTFVMWTFVTLPPVYMFAISPNVVFSLFIIFKFSTNKFFIVP